MDQHSFFLLDPDSGGKNVQRKKYKQKNARKLVITASLFKFLSKFAQSPLFLTLEQSFMSFTTLENSS